MATEKQLSSNRRLKRHAELHETKGLPWQDGFVSPNPEIHESGCEIITGGAVGWNK